MLNFFYMYAIIWGIILLFYSFGWSDLCSSIEPELFVFFVITIFASITLGGLLNKDYTFCKYEVTVSRSRFPVVIIVAFCILEFIYCGQVPLFYIILRGSGYTEYSGIPTLHTLVISYGSFYAQYLFYRYIQSNDDTKALLDYVIVLFFIFVLQFNRGGLVISVFMSLLMYLAKNSNKISKRINHKTIFGGIITFLLLMFAFGALGNLRHGFSLSDSSYIEELGLFNGTYPSWLPKQFMWAYIYIITPIANINYNVAMQVGSMNVEGYIMSLIPDFVSRRLFSDVIYKPNLVMERVFNATAGFGTAYMNAGTFGMYFFYIYMMFILTLLWKIIPIRKEYRMPCLAIMNAIVVFMFFTNTFYYSAISFQLIFPLLSFIRIKR